MLARFVEVDMHGERSRRLLEAAIAWLLYSVPHDVPRFGASWPASDGGFKRIGWCYGDAGVAGALLHASHALKSSTLEELALELLLQMTIPLQSQGVADASFCHGASGLAHIYNVAFQRTKNLQMRTQAELWLAEVLRLRSPGTGIAGYASLKIDGHAPRWEPDATLLSGAVGIALVLLAAVENRKPTWGQLFLL
jgi:hypothetical protein